MTSTGREDNPSAGVPAQSTDARLPVEIVAPLDIEKLAEAFKKFEEFKRRLLTKEDSVEIKGRHYLKKSAWRKWALACAVSDEIVTVERVPPQGNDADGDFSYRIVVRAFHLPTGRSSIGVAVASRSEKKDWTHLEHDIFSLSHTRAKNRSIADLVGGGEVSAEEVVPGETPPPSEPTGPSEVDTPPPSTSEVQLDPSVLERLPWTPFQEGHRAGWVKIDKASPDFVQALRKGPVELGGFVYKLSGLDGKLIARNPVGKK